jgi:hypothetical protein
MKANVPAFAEVEIYSRHLRPGSEDVSSQFFDELSAVFETLVVFACPVVIGGDFSVKFQLTDDSGARRMHELLTCSDMVHHVNGPTHCRGNTFDLVITPSGCLLSGVDVEPAGRYSDHSLVVCSLPLAVELPSAVERLVRGWRQVDRSAVQRMLGDSDLFKPQPDDVDQLFLIYETVLRNIADGLAPQHVTRRHPDCSALWFDAECRIRRRECRMLERRYRRTRSAADCRAWIDSTHSRFRLQRSKKEEY